MTTQGEIERINSFQNLLLGHYLDEPLDPEVLRVVEEYLKLKNQWFCDPQMQYEDHAQYCQSEDDDTECEHCLCPGHSPENCMYAIEESPDDDDDMGSGVISRVSSFID